MGHKLRQDEGTELLRRQENPHGAEGENWKEGGRTLKMIREKRNDLFETEKRSFRSKNHLSILGQEKRGNFMGYYWETLRRKKTRRAEGGPIGKWPGEWTVLGIPAVAREENLLIC